jgi:hypothetical protein
MIDMSLLQGTVTSLELAGDIAQGFLKLQSLAEVQGKVIDLQSAILAAQSSALEANAHQTAMVEEIRYLKEEIARIKAWEKEKQRYKLISPWEGTVLYALKKECSLSEPPHWICTKCYEDGRKSILNTYHKIEYAVFILVCPMCKAEYFAPHRSKPPIPQYASH